MEKVQRERKVRLMADEIIGLARAGGVRALELMDHLDLAEIARRVGVTPPSPETVALLRRRLDLHDSYRDEDPFAGLGDPDD